MLRKLTLAVLVISLAIAFVGSAFADDRKPTAQMREATFTPQSHQDVGQEAFNPFYEAVSLSKIQEATPMGVDVPYPSTYGPDHQCEILDYCDYNGTYYGWDFYGDYPYEVGSLFDVQALHYSAEVYGAAVRIYEASNNAGGCDLVFNVREDDGGVPGAIIYTETIPAATILANAPGNLLFSFSSTVAITSNTFYISYVAVGDATDYITVGLNRNADGTDNGRGVFYAGGWMPLGEGAFADPMNLRLAADICYFDYSDCYYFETGIAQLFDPVPVDYTIYGLPGIWDGWGQFFEVGNDTLKYVNVFTYIHHDAVPRYAGSNETNGLIVEIWEDDGAGNIDLSGPVATETIPGGLATMFPVTGDIRANGSIEDHIVDFSAYNLVFTGGLHVTARMTSTDIADGGVIPLWVDLGPGGAIHRDGVGWEMTWDPASDWYTSFWGNGVNFGVGIGMCKDEFNECGTQVLNAGGFVNAFTTGGNIWKVAQQVKGSDLGNRVETIRFQVADETPWGGLPDDNGDPEVILNVYTETIDVYGDFTPGAAVYSVNLGEPVYWPGWNEVVIPDVMLFGDFWVGYELVTADPENNWYNTCMDLGPFDVNSGAWAYYEPWGEWIHTNLFGGIDFNNWIMQVDFCEVPMPERPCNDLDWSTLQNDMARTGASGVGIGNAVCDLTKNWEYEHPTMVAQYVGPVIYDGILIATFRSGTGSEYVAFDLETKTQLYTIPVGGNVTGIPTVAYVPYIGADVLFVTGGGSLIVAAYEVHTGTPIFSIDATVNPLPGMGAGETNAMGNYITDGSVLWFTTNVGKVFAVWADDGSQCCGGIWPVDYYQIAAPGPTANRTGCFDGEYLYYGYSTILGGDIASVSAGDGSQNWLLTTDGLQGFNVWGAGITVEQFSGGISVDVPEGMLYAVSTCASSVHPITSVFYQINTGSGATASAQQCNGYNWPCTPVIDLDHVYVQFSPSGGYWVNQVNDAMNVQAFAKETGELDWGAIFGADNTVDWTSAEMLLTCEPDGAADLLFVFGRNGGLRCWNVETHVEMFSRRVTDNAFGGAAGAIGYDAAGDVHLVYETALGRMIDLTPQDDRARLQLLGSVFQSPVPFGSDDPYTVTFAEVFTNTGCVPLDVDITLLEASNGAPPQPSMVRPGLEDYADALAEQLTNNKSFTGTAEHPGDILSKDQGTRPAANPAATALWSWILNPTFSITGVGQGDDIDLDIDVVQADVGRGVFDVWAEFTTTNDPDYWLDVVDGPPAPEVQLTFLGGCVSEFTVMDFGLGGINSEYVWNSGRMSVYTPEARSFHWDGQTGDFFQGTYITGVDDTTLSINSHDWQASGEATAWRSWLPETYMGECVPILTTPTPVYLAEWSDDGVTYTPVEANVVHNNSIDSVQNHGDGIGGWDFSDISAPYDNDMTMGLLYNHQTIGVTDFGGIVDLIGNASIEIFTVTERNGDTVNGWVMGNYIDFDFDNPDTVQADFDINGAWCFSQNPSGARECMGQIRLPFGCGQDGLLNAWSVNQDSGFWGGTEWLDNFYQRMTQPQGEYSAGNVTGAGDCAAAFGIAGHDFTGGDSYEFAVATFLMFDEPYAAPEIHLMANQLNKFMGYGRGDVNNDDIINLADVIYLANWIGGYTCTAGPCPGPIPFMHLGDVNADGLYNQADVTYLVNYYFGYGACPLGAMMNKI